MSEKNKRKFPLSGKDYTFGDSNHIIITREMLSLQRKYATLMGVHMETLKKFQKSSCELDALKTEIVADLNSILLGKMAAPVIYNKYLGIRAGFAKI